MLDEPMQKVHYLAIHTLPEIETYSIITELSRDKRFVKIEEGKIGKEEYAQNKYFYAIGKPATDINSIVIELQSFLDSIITSPFLFIVDPYFFPKKRDSNYEQVVMDLVGRYLPILDQITIITNPDYIDVALKLDLETRIKRVKPSIKFHVVNRKDIHDRFWINDFANNGLFVGTSLNGLAKKYTLFDYLDKADVQTLVNELDLPSLISNP